MAKSTYRVTFADGSSVDKEAENADQAKAQAKNERIADVDPGRRLQAADLQRHNRVQVASVIELSEQERTDRASRGARADEAGAGERRDDYPRGAVRNDDTGRAGGQGGSPVIT